MASETIKNILRRKQVVGEREKQILQQQELLLQQQGSIGRELQGVKREQAELDNELKLSLETLNEENNLKIRRERILEELASKKLEKILNEKILKEDNIGAQEGKELQKIKQEFAVFQTSHEAELDRVEVRLAVLAGQGDQAVGVEMKVEPGEEVEEMKVEPGEVEAPRLLGPREEVEPGEEVEEPAEEVEEPVEEVEAPREAGPAADKSKKRPAAPAEVVVVAEVQRKMRKNEMASIVVSQLKVEAVPATFACAICQRSNTSAAALVSHMEVHHEQGDAMGERYEPGGAMYCTFGDCGFWGEPESLISHTRSKHTKEKLFPCKVCKFDLPTYEAMQAHVRKHAKPDLVWCAAACRVFHSAGNECRRK